MPRFPPSRFIQHLPSDRCHARLRPRASGRCRTNLNNMRHSRCHRIADLRCRNELNPACQSMCIAQSLRRVGRVILAVETPGRMPTLPSSARNLHEQEDKPTRHPLGMSTIFPSRPPRSIRVCASATASRAMRSATRGLISPRFSIPSNWPRSATNQSGFFLRSDVIE